MKIWDVEDFFFCISGSLDSILAKATNQIQNICSRRSSIFWSTFRDFKCFICLQVVHLNIPNTSPASLNICNGRYTQSCLPFLFFCFLFWNLIRFPYFPQFRSNIPPHGSWKAFSSFSMDSSVRYRSSLLDVMITTEIVFRNLLFF